ncbi:unnamed protein product [Trifolium pratense]|uniref:Uncharacterized protein n=2 Tax=Trifolium pratense TaxID=57577 RepID=A0ACB0KZ40_TRIPR|nr:unnamed protein product [Trifolium pratense]CAJ2661561.1 unnamed protein product [Trifolium pratense]
MEETHFLSRFLNDFGEVDRRKKLGLALMILVTLAKVKSVNRDCGTSS